MVAQHVPNDTLSFNLIPGAGILDPHKPHKGGGECGLPVVTLDGGLGLLLFDSNQNLVLPYSIINTNENVCLSGTLNIAAHQTASVLLSNLPDDFYKIYIVVGNSLYAAPFYILNDE